ncbi:MAG TPA: DoxX family protein [Pseudonocardia sp.]|nr:DoxX family protein [Pseudonocardia sp.]
MLAAYVVVTVAAVAANTLIAVADLRRAEFVLANSASVGVPRSWLTPLALLKLAGAAGLVLGLAGVPVVGTAAAAGLTLFFVGAVLTHLRARNHALVFPGTYLLLAASSLVLGLAL